MRRENPIRRTNPSGRVVWIARYTDRNGKRRVAKPEWNGGKGTFPLKRDAQRAIDEAYAQMEGRAPQTMTVGRYYETWLARHPRPMRTEQSHVSKIRAVLDVEILGVPLRDYEFDGLRRSHAIALVDHMLRAQGRAARGASSVLAVLSAMTEDAIGDDAAGANPFKGVLVRKSDPRVQKAPRSITRLDWSEMHRIAALAGPYEPMLRVLSDCGLRLGEMLALYRADWMDEELHVGRTAWAGRLYDGTKTTHGASEAKRGRVVPVPPDLRAMLRDMPKRIDSLLLFPSPRGRVWHAHNWRRRVWEPTVQRAGVRCTPHDFRHSWVSNLRAAGIDPADLANAAGHTVETATTHYTHGTGRSFDAIKGAVGA